MQVFPQAKPFDDPAGHDEYTDESQPPQDAPCSVAKAVSKALIMIAALLVGWAVAVHAKPPPGADLNSPTHAWFEAQRTRQGYSCCSIADGHVLEEDDIRETANGWEVRIDGTWHPVPESKVIHSDDNPTGKTVVWYVKLQEGVESPIVFYCLLPWRHLI
jgi:hypothetical protein